MSLPKKIGRGALTRAWVDGSWSDLRSYTLDALDITCPCRLVPLADADRDPDLWGPL